MSINKEGRLASCSNLEWTEGMFKEVWTKDGKTRVFAKDEEGNLIPKNQKARKDFTAVHLELGKCYKKDSDKNTFSFLLENNAKKIFNPEFPNKKGKNALKIYLMYLFQ